MLSSNRFIHAHVAVQKMVHQFRRLRVRGFVERYDDLAQALARVFGEHVEHVGDGHGFHLRDPQRRDSAGDVQDGRRLPERFLGLRPAHAVQAVRTSASACVESGKRVSSSGFQVQTGAQSAGAPGGRDCKTTTSFSLSGVRGEGAQVLVSIALVIEDAATQRGTRSEDLKKQSVELQA